ncbi:hypothetical protein M1D30_03435 [Prevotella sp. E15-22]|uniref:hypothetical protein n=1 Tax=Prevotella sp. E15-22 TaxID=2937774 RepID=UPI00205C11AA|nr:hypothetical protein [Prevotella sp. E15-22]UPS45236.1 hypothetical protein M1D30_03435 [Prevotella sp. E15-22]
MFLIVGKNFFLFLLILFKSGKKGALRAREGKELERIRKNWGQEWERINYYFLLLGRIFAYSCLFFSNQEGRGPKGPEKEKNWKELEKIGAKNEVNPKVWTN